VFPRWLALPLALLGLALGGSAASEGNESTLPPPGGAGWQPLAFPKIERHTQYRPGEEDGRPIVRAESACGASGLLFPLAGVDLARTPILRWRWRLDTPLAPADERRKDGDDFAARVYVAFAFEPARAGLLERAGRRMAEVVYGADLPGSSLSYVWSSRAPLGAHWPNPYTDASRMIVAASGDRGGWRAAEVDLLADYTRLFEAPAPPALFLALMTDADNRCLTAAASYADFRFAPRP
jgi:hypothetical protein